MIAYLEQKTSTVRFGTEKNFTNLKLIDMTDNNIEKIMGKTFLHAPAVKQTDIISYLIKKKKSNFLTSMAQKRVKLLHKIS